ncbi:MAG: hypothetical protein M3O28_03600 [Actinomycetota bacterium]|nr:hypothetical protein [Actinomycetota bacterium]
MSSDNDPQTVFTRLTFVVFLSVIVLIAVLLISQRIPHAQRPTLHQLQTVVTTVTSSPN